jgi:low temperature requirement protein LtrA
MYNFCFQICNLVIVVVAFIGSFVELPLDKVTDFMLAAALIELVCGRVFQPYFQKYFYTGRFIYFPLNIASSQHRWGIFIMIVLGESFVSMLTVDPAAGYVHRVYPFLLCAFVLIFSLAVSFFDSVQRDIHSGEPHAMVRSKVAGIVWQMLHIVLGFSLFITGIGLKHVYKDVVYNKETEKSGAELIAYGCGYE